ncbi:hypothetical protein BS50DRAFT_638490 [Corynespora cassiicola Philippines]|uniref:Uncharacterized protein n=1 Tax=Corynespora cassiicola Philippines TaxID=1448308 RepID=A0A2T2NBY3_CORCC|nr:hypothetical protein BS50DRAFT_638490 [Corynespora cassiicola Philippines]
MATAIGTGIDRSWTCPTKRHTPKPHWGVKYVLGYLIYRYFGFFAVIIANRVF